MESDGNCLAMHTVGRNIVTLTAHSRFLIFVNFRWSISSQVQVSNQLRGKVIFFVFCLVFTQNDIYPRAMEG